MFTKYIIYNFFYIESFYTSLYNSYILAVFCEHFQFHKLKSLKLLLLIVSTNYLCCAHLCHRYYVIDLIRKIFDFPPNLLDVDAIQLIHHIFSTIQEIYQFRYLLFRLQ